MTEVKHVDPNDLHAWWDYVKDDLDYCRAHDREEVWLEDIYTSLKVGRCWLLVCLMDGEYSGMMVVTQHTDQFSPSRRWVHVWYCRIRGGHAMVDAADDALDVIARNVGATTITFRSDRTAFERWGKRRGYELAEIELRREVRDEKDREPIPQKPQAVA